MNEPTHNLRLSGCTPEPLMAYLKALGILRLVSQQKDPGVRGWWKNGVFWLQSTLDSDELLRFFLEEYKPTPIVVPWSGNDFFGVNWQARPTTFRATPTSSRVIEALLATQTDRFEHYRRSLRACKVTLDRCGIGTKSHMEKNKWRFIQQLRSICDEPLLVEWLDAAAAGTVEKFSPLLGSGGGNDGNTHFSDNFMQNLWDVLPDFDDQREHGRRQPAHSTIEISQELLCAALYKRGTNRLVLNRTSSLFDSGAVGGPNATQGMERDSLSNPWNVILSLEGAISFAGAVAKRLGADGPSVDAFPFQLAVSATPQGGLSDKESSGTELWLPLWGRPALSEEILALLREGRADCGPRPARTGTDMARAAVSLGVDRGIDAFCRYAILKGRVGGDNYNTAASLGCLRVVPRKHVNLLREIDPWLDRFRYAVKTSGGENKSGRPNPRFASALRAIESAVVDFCKYGHRGFFQRILIALGRAEREMALTPGKIGQSKVPSHPIDRLSAAWIGAVNDKSAEFAIAHALAGVQHLPVANIQPKIGPLRTNLEPVTWGKRHTKWADTSLSVVWNAADLTVNMTNVLIRRMIDGARTGCEHLPLFSPYTVPLDSVGAFINGDVDDNRIEELLWGLMLVDSQQWSHRGRDSHGRDSHGADGVALPRAYALLKLLFLPRPLVIQRTIDGNVHAHLLRDDESGGVVIRPEPSILYLLQSKRLGEACALATRRLRASGLSPMPKPLRGRRMLDRDWEELARIGDTGIDRLRLAAALLIPIDDTAVAQLVEMVIGKQDTEEKLLNRPHK